MRWRATDGLILVNVAVFIAAVATGSHAALLERYGFVAVAVAAGDVGRAVVSGFLHTGVPHLTYNMVFLWLFGRACEEEFGPGRTVLVYAAGLLGGEVFFAALFPSSSAVGASGAVFAIMTLAVLVEPGRPVHPRVPLPISLLGAVYLVPAVMSATTLAGDVAHIAHVGGAVAGGLLAFRWEPDRAEDGLWVVVGLAMLVAALGATTV